MSTKRYVLIKVLFFCTLVLSVSSAVAVDTGMVSGKIQSINMVTDKIKVGSVEMVLTDTTTVYLSTDSGVVGDLRDLRTGYTVACRFIREGKAPYVLETVRLISKYSSYKMPQL